jgi:exodeoxyribonuclease VII large subunit
MTFTREIEIHEEGEIFSVSQLNQQVRGLLEYALPFVWVEGEISNLRAPGSGHLYFSLKDNNAQVRCALFRNRYQPQVLQAKDGMQVLVRARVSLYEERGDFQLIVEEIEEIGDGALRRAFEQLKKQLSAQGLFDQDTKRPLPKLPRCIGVVTSPTGAAIRDILSVLKRRFPAIPVIIYPTQVQGSLAADQIVQALAIANKRKECDVIILTRGGGSLEDLWPFNEERVARAVYDSEIPIVSGVGHEIDTTIADFVADQRAATPSAAAELVSPDSSEWLMTVTRLELRLTQMLQQELRHLNLIVEQLGKRLPHPRQRLQDQAQRLDSLEQRLQLAQTNFLRHKTALLQHLTAQLHQHTPLHQLQLALTNCLTLKKRLQTQITFHCTQAEEKLHHYMQRLDNISPLNTLKRGYAIATHNNTILQSAQNIKVGDKLNLTLAHGKLDCTVDKKLP